MCLGVLAYVSVIAVVLLHKKPTSHKNDLFSLLIVCKVVRFARS